MLLAAGEQVGDRLDAGMRVRADAVLPGVTWKGPKWSRNTQGPRNGVGDRATRGEP
jgi:hypothetical protein